MFSLFIILPLFAAQTDTSNLIYRCDFEDPIQTCFNGKTPDDPHNCLIVPCTNLDEKNHCMVITSKAHGGDCFTDYFEHGVDLDEDEDLLALHPEIDGSTNSGIYVGYEEEQTKNFYWIAMHEPNYQTFNETTQHSVQLVALHNIWTKVSILIKPQSSSKIRFFFEDWDGIPNNVAGDFLIDNITLFHRGICSPHCAACMSYDYCTACTSNHLLVKGQCVYQVCYSQLESLTDDVAFRISKVYDYVVTFPRKNLKINNCFNFSLKIQDKKLTEGEYQIEYESGDTIINVFDINSDFFQKHDCPFKNYTNYSIYTCKFYLSILDQETLLQQTYVEWKQDFQMNYDLTIDFNFENKKIIGISKDNLEAIYSLNVKAELCTSRDCDEYRTKNDRRIIINEYFYIIMKIDDDNYAKHFSLKHNSTFLMGNGTLIPITPAEEFMKVRDLILKFKVNTVQENGYLQINCKVIDDKNEESGRRMLQQSEEKYVAGDNLFLVSIEPEKEKIFDIKVIYIVVCIVLGFSFLVLVGCCIYKCMNKKNDQSIIYEVNREEATRVQLRTHNNQESPQNINEESKLNYN